VKWLLLMACAVLCGCAADVETPEHRFHREVTEAIDAYKRFEPAEVENDVTITLPNGPKDGDLFRYRKAGNSGWYESFTDKVETITNTHPFKLLQDEMNIVTNALWTIDGRTYPTVVTWSLDDSFANQVVIRTNSVVVTRTNLVLQVEHDGKTNYITLKEGK
jgi:hypothetical protein